MEVVPKTSLAPGRCLLTGDFQGPYLDTGFDYHFSMIGESGRAYLHVPLVEQMGEAVGMVRKARYDEALNVISQQDQDIAELQKEVASLRAQAEAIQTIERSGYKAKKKRGPKPKVAA